MATDAIVPSYDRSTTVPPLQSGDRLTREEFLRRYDAMHHVNKAELIEGVVYVPSPVSVDHGESHFDFVTWLGTYRARTPGVIWRRQYDADVGL